MKTLNGPNHEPVVPFEGTSLLSRETLHRAPTRFTVCFLSKSKPGERPLERRSITRHNKHRCPSISALVSLSSFLLYFIAGMARRDAANKDSSHESTTDDDGKPIATRSNLTEFKRQFSANPFSRGVSNE